MQGSVCIRIKDVFRIRIYLLHLDQICQAPDILRFA